MKTETSSWKNLKHVWKCESKGD